MKKIDRILGLGFLIILITLSCKKVDLIKPNIIDLGVKPTSTSIKSINQNNNMVSVVLETTVGSKYSLQIIPFGDDTPVKKLGFTATDIETKKIIDLADLPKKDYDMIFIDISGNQIKYPITIK
jgi:hypothetical protein